MEPDLTIDYKQEKQTPFYNRFLTTGFLTGRNDVWIYILGILAAFMGYLIFQFIIMIPLMSAAASMGITMKEIVKDPNILFNPDAIGMNRSVVLAFMMGMFVFTLLFLVIIIKTVHKKPVSSVITAFGKIRWKRYFFSFSIWSILLISLTTITYFTSPGDLELRFNGGKFALLCLVAIIMVPIQTATEEILFRGYLMQGLGLAFKNGIIPLLVTSVLFGLMHASNPEVKEHGLLIMMPYYILFGVFLGVLTLLDEGLELAMGIHCANNLMSCLLVSPEGSVLKTDAIFYTSKTDPAAEFVSWIIMALVCFFILFKTYKLSNWKLLIR